MKKFLMGFSFLLIMTGIGYYNGTAATEDISVPATSYLYEYNNSSDISTPQNTENIQDTTTSHNNSSNTENNINTPSTDNANTETVYIGKTGTKYHKSDCSSLKGKGTAVSLSEAISQGRTPCGICYKDSAENNNTDTEEKNSPTNSDTNTETVYIGKTGTKYHKRDCSSLKGKGTAVSLSEAISQGRTPCGICMGD